MKRKVLGLLLFLLIIPLFMGCDQKNSIGTVTIEIKTLGDNPETTEVEESYISRSEEVGFAEEETLFDLLMETFDMSCAAEDGSADDACEYAGQYGHYILSIDTLIPTEANEYISFSINGEYAMSGADSTMPNDGDVFTFEIGSF